MLTQKELKEILHYDPDTGVFTWLVDTDRYLCKGKIAGYVQSFKHTKTEYRMIHISGKPYGAHRLVWIYLYGKLPNNEIDHIDGDGLNNAISNLRDVSKGINQKNRKLNSNNSSGYVGIWFVKKTKKWVAELKDKGKKHHIGTFANKQDAIDARKEAEKKYGFHENHGRN